MTRSKPRWIDFATRQPAAGQFVLVEVRERVESHVIEYEGQARYDHEKGWLAADGAPYLSADQEILRWKPLLEDGAHDEWDDFVGDLARD